MLSSIYQDPVFSGLLTSAILALIAVVWRRAIKQYKRAMGHLEGDWFGHIIVDLDRQMIVHEVNFSLSLNIFRPVRVSMKEVSAEQFQYAGYAKAVDRLVICYLEGVSQFDEAFMILRCPFNKGSRLDYINGILAGVNQNSHPGAAFILLARARLTKDAVLSELPKQAGPILVDSDPSQIEARKLKALSPSEPPASSEAKTTGRKPTRSAKSKT